MVNLWIVLLFTFLMATTPADQNGNIHLTVTNTKNDSGVVRVLLFKSEQGFPNEPKKAFRSVSAPIKNNKASVTFENLPSGDYAISAFHDSQNTGELRTNMFGIPKDRYGFSNNVTGNFGPPSFEKASFQLDKTIKVAIELR